ncbi:MAG: tail fiber domain-containing protein [Lysobacterales bacterium]
MRLHLAFATLCGLLLGAAPVIADARTSLSYRGELLDRGQPAHGRFDLRYTLLQEDGTAFAAPVTLYDVDIQQGRIAVDVDFGLDLDQAPPLKLKTEVAGRGAGFVAIGKPERIEAKSTLVGVCWDTQGNAGTNAATDFLGTTDNQPLVLRAANEPALRLTAASSFQPVNGQPVAVNVSYGSGSNTISGVGGVVGGGTVPHPSNPFITFTGLPALANAVSSDFGIVAGGYSNQAGDGSFTGRFATVSGGAVNTAGSVGTTVSGGIRNTAMASAATVTGGSNNTAAGISSTVVGGGANCAGGSVSLAAGARAKVRPGNAAGASTCAANSGDADGDEGTFLWSDVSGAVDFVSNGPNRFLVRADGGVTFQRLIGTESNARRHRGYFNVVQGDSGVTTPITPAANVVGSFESDGDAFLVLTTPTGNSRGLIFRSPIASSEAGISYANSTSGLQFTSGNSVRMTLAGTGQLTLNTLGSAGTTSLCRNASNQIASCSSSARYKSDIEDLHLGLDAVARLRPVSYTWKDGGMADIGFVAEEVAALDERLVTRNEQGQVEGVKYERLSAVLAGAVQELAARDSLQQSEIEEMRRELAELRALVQGQIKGVR